MRTALFSARFDQLDNIRGFVNHAAEDAGMDEPGLCAVEMAVDEACSNIIEHAYTGVNNGEIEITCEADGDRITIILRDHGTPFDILDLPAPDLSGALSERKVGGLGVFLMRKLMDEIRYEHLGNAGNVLTMRRSLRGRE